MTPVTLKWHTPDGDAMIAHMARVSNSSAKPEDPAERLIAYLIRNHHWSPFEMANLCLEINTQRDISAQILRHRSFSFQEFSTRYAAVEQLLECTECRWQDPKNRQSSRTIDEMNEEAQDVLGFFDSVVEGISRDAAEAYRALLDRGVAKEVARRILPIGLTPTRLYMNGTVRSWLHYCAERTKPGVQREHQLVALAASDVLRKCFPLTYSAAVSAGMFA